MSSLKAQKATAPAFMPGDGRAMTIPDKAVLGAASGGGLGTPGVGDTIDFLLPAGTLLTDLHEVHDDCDTGTTFAGSWGYRPVDPAAGPTANATYFAAAGAVAQSAGRTDFSFKPIKFEADVYICLTVTAAPTGISGNPEIHVVASGAAEGVK